MKLDGWLILQLNQFKVHAKIITGKNNLVTTKSNLLYYNCHLEWKEVKIISMYRDHENPQLT